MQRMQRREASFRFHLRRAQNAAATVFAVALLAATVYAGFAQPARAAELRWRNRPFTIVANGRKIGDFIRELASSQGVTAVVDPRVDGTISGRFSGTPQQTLDTICSTYGLTWYYDGSFLYVDPANASQSQVIPIPPDSAGEIGRSLAAMQIPDKRYSLVINDRTNSIYVSGPPRYIELVRQAVTTAGNPSTNGQLAEVRAFRLKYGWASDFTINRSGKEVVVPGVASMLKRLYGRGGQANPYVPRTAMLGNASRQMKLGSGVTIDVPRIEFPDMPGNAQSGSGSFGPSSASPDTPLPLSNDGGGDGSSLPQFEADPAINAVLVRDLPQNMYRYQQLIDALDQRPRIVEINVTIIDIDENSLDSLGVDWRLHTPHGDVQIGNGDSALNGNTQYNNGNTNGNGNPPLTFATSGNEAGQTGTFMPTGIALTASIGGSLRNYLLTRINALTQTGKAEVHSKPKVLALDNTEAILENLTEFYVQVQGFQDSSLYSVTTGTSIKVTPMIVDESNTQTAADPESVMMSIDIQDGNVVPNQSVSNIPVIQQRNIVTKAMIDEGKSLLIAGFDNSQVQISKSGVPWLSSIPLIGNLFRYTDKTGDHMERFYLLTPRVVTTASMYAPDGSPVNPAADARPDANGLASYRPPDNDEIVPLTPKPQPGSRFGPPPPPPPPKDAASQPAAAGRAGEASIPPAPGAQDHVYDHP